MKLYRAYDILIWDRLSLLYRLCTQEMVELPDGTLREPSDFYKALRQTFRIAIPDLASATRDEKSVRHAAFVHRKLTSVATWYGVDMGTAFDVLIWDRVQKLFLQSVEDMKNPDNRNRLPDTFEAAIRKLFDIDCPPELEPHAADVETDFTPPAEGDSKPIPHPTARRTKGA